MRLLLIRHGQTPANVLGSLDTAHPGPGLTRLGKRQAAEIPRALRDIPIDGIFTSTLTRTKLTATPLAKDRELEIQVRRGLHEIEAGELEARTDHESVRTYLETVFQWGFGNLDARIPGGANGLEFFARFDDDIEDIARVTDTAAVFSHGAAIRSWVAGRAKNITPRFAAENHLGNTGIVELNGSPGNWQLTAWAGAPVGGPQLVDASADDPTGEKLSEAEADAAGR
jgi:broad specificity phosphatase PhoE